MSFPHWSRILIVDDSPIAVRSLRDELVRLGYNNIVEATDGKQALEILAKSLADEKFELVIADWKMPNMPGIVLLEHLRETPLFKTLPFIFLTTEKEISDIGTAMASGASNYITKPLDAEILKKKLESTWKKAKAGKL